MKPTPAPLFNYRKRQRQAILSDPSQRNVETDSSNLNQQRGSGIGNAVSSRSFESASSDFQTFVDNSNVNNTAQPSFSTFSGGARNMRKPNLMDMNGGFGKRQLYQNTGKTTNATSTSESHNTHVGHLQNQENRSGGMPSFRGNTSRGRGVARGRGGFTSGSSSSTFASGFGLSGFSKTSQAANNAGNKQAFTAHTTNNLRNKQVFTAQNSGFNSSSYMKAQTSQRGGSGASKMRGTRVSSTSTRGNRGKGSSSTAVSATPNRYGNSSFENNFTSNSNMFNNNTGAGYNGNTFNFRNNSNITGSIPNSRGSFDNNFSNVRGRGGGGGGGGVGRHRGFNSGSVSSTSRAGTASAFDDNNSLGVGDTLMSTGHVRALPPTQFKSQEKSKSSVEPLRVFTCPIAVVREWTDLDLSVGCVLFEVYGIVDSATLRDPTGTGKEFILRDDKASIKCVFYEIDRDLPRLVRGQVHRVVGSMMKKKDTLRVVSVRPTEKSERLVCQMASELTQREMEELANGELQAEQ